MKTTQSSVHELRYRRSVISYALSYKERKTLAIEVHPNGQVVVIAPYHSPFENIQVKVKKRSAWILKQQRMFESYPSPVAQREYVLGESCRYLSRQYRFKVIEGIENSVRLYRGRLELRT
jgi:predicted metal-dependent hydrolase